MSSPNELLWHYSDGTNQIGPLGGSAIRQLARAGVIHADYLIRREGEGEWTRFADVDLDITSQIQIPATPVAPQPLPVQDAVYHLSRGGSTAGPYQGDELRLLIQCGEVILTDLVWKPGLENWVPVKDVPELSVPGNAQARTAVGLLSKYGERLKGSGILLCGALPILIYFAAHLAVSYYVAHWENPEPEYFSFSWPRAIKSILGLALSVMVPAIGLAWVQHYRSRCKAAGKTAPAWIKWGIVILWIILPLLCIWIGNAPKITSGFARLVWLFMQGAGGTFALLLLVVPAIGVLVSSTKASHRFRRQLASLKKDNAQLPLIPLVAEAWSKASVILLFTALIAPAFVMIHKWPRQENTDGQTAQKILGALARYERMHPGVLVKEWMPKFNTPKSEDWWFQSVVKDGRWTSSGDLEGAIEEPFIRIINQDSEDGSIFGAPGNPPSQIKDIWDRSFRVAIDANGDGKVQVGDREIEARFIVWSTGWNGYDQYGRGDDVLRRIRD